MKITAYKIVEGYAAELDVQVNLLIKEGWQPYGPPSGAPGGASIWLIQAMIKIEPTPHPMSAPSPK